MLRSREILRVYPVPFAALDARGMPAAAVRFDPPTGRKKEVHFIGCTRNHTLVERRKREEGRASVYATSFQYDISPQRITHTDYHVQRIRHGELIAADPTTAKIAGVRFVPPDTAFERARYAAIQRWTQEYGEPPPVEAWPELRLLAPDDDTPSTAPAHGASMRAKGVQAAAGGGVAAQVAPAPAPAVVPAAVAPPAAPPGPHGSEPPGPPAGEIPAVAAPATAFVGTPLPHLEAEAAPPTPHVAVEHGPAVGSAAGGSAAGGKPV